MSINVPQRRANILGEQKLLEFVHMQFRGWVEKLKRRFILRVDRDILVLITELDSNTQNLLPSFLKLLYTVRLTRKRDREEK